MLSIDSLYNAMRSGPGERGEKTKEEKARWLIAAISDHLRMVRNFAAAYPELYAYSDSDIDRERWRTFTDAARRRAAGVEDLWKLVKQAPDLAELADMERLEAEIDDLRSLIRSLPSEGRPWKEN